MRWCSTQCLMDVKFAALDQRRIDENETSRSGLKIQWPQGRVGSSPTSGTSETIGTCDEKLRVLFSSCSHRTACRYHISKNITARSRLNCIRSRIGSETTPCDKRRSRSRKTLDAVYFCPSRKAEFPRNTCCPGCSSGFSSLAGRPAPPTNGHYRETGYPPPLASRCWPVTRWAATTPACKPGIAWARAPSTPACDKDKSLRRRVRSGSCNQSWPSLGLSTTFFAVHLASRRCSSGGGALESLLVFGNSVGTIPEDFGAAI